MNDNIKEYVDVMYAKILKETTKWFKDGTIPHDSWQYLDNIIEDAHKVIQFKRENGKNATVETGCVAELEEIRKKWHLYTTRH